MLQVTRKRVIPEWTTAEQVDAVAAKQEDLSGREYAAIKQFWGAMDLISIIEYSLGKRLQKIPGGLRDLRMLKTVSERLFQKMLWTIPEKRLETLKREMPHYELAIYMTGATVHDVNDQDHLIIRTRALHELMRNACSYECFGCEKCGKAARRCSLYKALKDCLPYDTKFDTESECPFADGRLTAMFTWEGEE